MYNDLYNDLSLEELEKILDTSIELNPFKGKVKLSFSDILYLIRDILFWYGEWIVLFFIICFLIIFK